LLFIHDVELQLGLEIRGVADEGRGDFGLKKAVFVSEGSDTVQLEVAGEMEDLGVGVSFELLKRPHGHRVIGGIKRSRVGRDLQVIHRINLKLHGLSPFIKVNIIYIMGVLL